MNIMMTSKFLRTLIFYYVLMVMSLSVIGQNTKHEKSPKIKKHKRGAATVGCNSPYSNITDLGYINLDKFELGDILLMDANGKLISTEYSCNDDSLFKPAIGNIEIGSTRFVSALNLIGGVSATVIPQGLKQDQIEASVKAYMKDSSNYCVYEGMESKILSLFTKLNATDRKINGNIQSQIKEQLYQAGYYGKEKDLYIVNSVVFADSLVLKIGKQKGGSVSASVIIGDFSIDISDNCLSQLNIYKSKDNTTRIPVLYTVTKCWFDHDEWYKFFPKQ